jgi:hypothetical protein
MSGEIGLESGAYSLFAEARSIPCLNAPIERIAGALPACGEVPDLPRQPGELWRLSAARPPLRVILSQKDSANLVGDSRPRVTELLAQREAWINQSIPRARVSLSE